MMEGLFATITNVDFDPRRLEATIRRAYELKEKLRTKVTDAYQKKHGKPLAALAAVTDWKPAAGLAGLVEQGRSVGIMANPAIAEDIRSLREILLVRLKRHGCLCRPRSAARAGRRNR